MKFLLLSDVHLLSNQPISRIDDVSATQLLKFRYILQYAQKHNLTVLSAGDLFDKPRSWNLLPEILLLLKKSGVEWNAVWGQHDQYFRSSESSSGTNLGILEKAGLITILSEWPKLYIEGDSCTSIYGASWGHEIPKIKSKKKGQTNILVIHAPIGTTALFPGHKYDDATRFIKKHDFDLVLAGDIHRKFHKKYEGRQIVNTGPMIRREATEYNFAHEPCFAVYDTETKHVQFHKIPCLEADQALTAGQGSKRTESSEMLERFVEGVKTQVTTGLNITESINLFCKANKIEKEVLATLSKVMEEEDGN